MIENMINTEKCIIQDLIFRNNSSFLLPERMFDLILHSLGQSLHIPGMVGLPGRGEDSLHVDVLHPGVIFIFIAVDVSQQTAHGVKDGLRSAGVPLLTAGAGEHVGAGLPLHQEDDLVSGPAHLHHPVWLEDVESVLDQPGAVAPGGGDDSLSWWREG